MGHIDDIFLSTLLACIILVEMSHRKEIDRYCPYLRYALRLNLLKCRSHCPSMYTLSMHHCIHSNYTNPYTKGRSNASARGEVVGKNIKRTNNFPSMLVVNYKIHFIDTFNS